MENCNPENIKKVIERGELQEFKDICENRLFSSCETCDYYIQVYSILYDKFNIFEYVIKNYPKKYRTINFYMEACKYSSINIIDLCIKDGYDIYDKDESGNNGLHYASKHNNLNVVNYLLKQGLDLNYKNKFGDTPYSIIKKRYKKNIDELIDMSERCKIENYIE